MLMKTLQFLTTYSIRSIPALLIFKDGEKISEKMGALPKSALTIMG